MPIEKSKFKYMYDAAPSASLMTKGDDAQDATFTGAGFALDLLLGYWNTGTPDPADQSFAAIINVDDVNVSASVGIIALDTVVATDAVTIDDGPTSVTFTADTDFDVGADDDETAANLADAINDSALNVTAVADGPEVTVTNLNGDGGAITTADSTIDVTDFEGGDETYRFDLEGGPVGFASSVVLGTVTIGEAGQYVIPVDADTAKKVKSDLAAVRIKGTLAGSAPSITAYSWVAGVQK